MTRNEFLSSWVVAILAYEDDEQKESELYDLCEIVGIEPKFRFRPLEGKNVLLFNQTLHEVCKVIHPKTSL